MSGFIPGQGRQRDTVAPSRYPRATELDRLGDEQQSIRRELDRQKLLQSFTRIEKFAFGEERMAVQQAIAALGLGAFNDRAITRMLATAEAKLKTLPAERRSMEFRAATRATGNRTMSFIASTDSIDRHGSKILPLGIQYDRYLSQNPVVGFSHALYGGFFSTPDPSNVIGRTLRLRASEHKLEADIEFLPPAVNARADMIWQQLKLKALNSVSIGFLPIEVRYELVDGRDVPVIAKSELLEISVVPLPSQSDAVAINRE